MMKKYISILTLVVAFSGLAFAQPKGYKKAPNGLLYNFHMDKEGAKAKEGDIVKLHFVFKTDKDSVLRSTFAENTPIEMPLQKGTFKGSLEDGLMMMSIGDSASFLINADSLFAKMFNSPLPPFIKSGSNVCFLIKIINIMSEAQYQEEQRKIAGEMIAKEDKTIQEFMTQNKMVGVKTASGLYYVQTKAGNGIKPENGKTVSVHYTGKLLNGTKFDSSVDRGQPFEFSLGVGQVIKGWDEGVALMSIGEKGFLLIPSGLGYGPRGAGGSIPPNSVLVFEVELLGIK
jgi:FKBP-type peptidyl-prolyl cis-trans isomerase FkpA